MNRDRATLNHFGLDPDRVYWGSQHEIYAERIRDAVISRRMTSVIGPFGSGKSVLVSSALSQVKNLRTVYVNQPDRERLRIGQVVSSMIFELSSENPRRDNTTRMVQLTRILRQIVHRGNEVCVVIENAHRMHADTLLALKDLRESVNQGHAFLFSVILVGQEPLHSKLERYGEVSYRTKTIDLTRNGWMSFAERTAYLKQIYGPVIEARTRDRLATLFTSPLELDHFIEGKLELMREGGLTVLDSETFPLTIREQRKALQISIRTLSKAAGIAHSAISDVEHGRNQDAETKQRIQDALDTLVEDKKRRAA